MKKYLLILTLFSSALMTLAIPNELFHYGSLSIALIALVPLFMALYRSPSAGFSSLLGVVYALSNSFATYFWLLFFQDFSIWTCTGVALGHSLYLVLLFPVFSRLLKTGGIFRPALIACAWVSYEYIKSIGYLGFPWGLMAYPLEKFLPLVQIADITGLWSISFLAVLVNAVIAESLPGSASRENYSPGGIPSPMSVSASRPILRNLVFVLALSVLVLIYGTVRLGTEFPYEKKLKVVLIQQNADSWVHGLEMPSIVRGQELTRDALSDFDADIIVWSENSFREPYYLRTFLHRPKEDPFVPFLGESRAPLLVGSPIILDWEKREAMNGAVLIDRNGAVLDTYGKQHPVPLAEHIPYWEVPFVRNFFENVVGLHSAGWTMGDRYTVFRVVTADGAPVFFGVPICFEDAFPYIGRGFFLEGADLLINITNDSWSRTISAETQHFAAARLRAVESRRVLIRSSNAGVTAVVDPAGRITGILPLFEEGYLTAEVPVYRTDTFTPYMVYGDWFAWIAILACAGYLIFYRILEKRTRPGT